jgi:uncharacterized membrane protein YjgN (DUF898 family)
MEPALPSAAATPALRRPPSTETFTFAFFGTGMAFFALILKNLVLTLLTVGFYLPWARTERRKYLWQNIEIEGHRLRYHGTGKELFFGYLKVVLAYLVFVGVPLLLGKVAGQAAQAIAQTVLALVLVPLIPYAIWGSRRYLLSRTSWRGVHFRLGNGVAEYAKTLIFGYLLTIVSLGLYGPIWLNKLHRIMVDHTALGTRSFEYRGEDKVAWRIGIKGLVLSVLTLGIYFFWYQAELMRYQLSNTWFDRARGESSLTGGDLLKLTLLQLFGLTLTLGLAFPWIACYSLSFTLARIRFVGPVDFSAVYQAQSPGSAAADGLADALDIGVGL